MSATASERIAALLYYSGAKGGKDAAAAAGRAVVIHFRGTRRADLADYLYVHCGIGKGASAVAAEEVAAILREAGLADLPQPVKLPILRRTASVRVTFSVPVDRESWLANFPEDETVASIQSSLREYAEEAVLSYLRSIGADVLSPEGEREREAEMVAAAERRAGWDPNP